MTRQRHFSYANVMSTLAVFFAVAGGSVAIAAIPDPDSVDSSVVIDDSLKSRDLMDDNAVQGADVIDDTLEADDLATGAVTNTEIATGAVGSAEIATDAVGSDEIITNAVGSGEIVADSVNTSELAPSSVTSTEIFNGTIIGDDIGDGQVDASELGDDAVYRVAGNEVTVDDGDAGRNGDYSHGEASASCSGDGGSGELIAGTGKWIDDGNPGAGEELVISEVRLNMTTEEVNVIGGNDSGDPFGLVAEAICISY